jgi:hypothetical protein
VHACGVLACSVPRLRAQFRPRARRARLLGGPGGPGHGQARQAAGRHP